MSSGNGASPIHGRLAAGGLHSFETMMAPTNPTSLLRRHAAATLVAAFAGVLAMPMAAQNNSFDLPITTSFASTNLPLAAGQIRWQQFYSPLDWLNAAGEPTRVTQIDFRAGSGPQRTATTLDLEVTMAHADGFSASGVFAANLDRNVTRVFPRAQVMLNSVVSGAIALSIPFPQLFTWDGSSSVVVEIKVFGNGSGGSVFPYDLRSTNQAPGRVTRLWALNNPNATASQTLQNGTGTIIQFSTRQGASVPFGTSCPAQGGFVPEHTVTNIGFPASNWVHQVSSAPSQRPAIWFIGGTDLVFGSAALPLDLTMFGGAGCFLYTSPNASLLTTTSGGGPGSGFGSITLPLMPTTNQVGATVFTQWLILDPFAPGGRLVTTNAIKHIIGPPGG